MTSPIDSETLPPGESGARLPALGSPELSPAFLSKVKEIIESLLGRRGSQWDRAVTFRDLAQGGLIVPSAGAGAWQPNDAGSPNVVLRTQLESELRNSAAFRNLMTRIGSVDDLAQYPDEIRAQLASSIAELALQRQADLVTIERKIQSSNLSFASRLEEITAALDNAAAGVRHLDSAYSDRTGSLAASLTQVQAQLGSDPGDGVTVEEKLVAQASDISGLQGQWSVKIQAGSDANPVIAGIALSATSPTAGAGTSALTILADKFGVFTSGGAVMPFGVDATGAYVNGLLRVNSAGVALQDIAVGAKRLELTPSSQVFQISKAGTNAPSSISLSARALNLAGSPNWTVPAGTATLSAGADAWNKTLTFANMTSDTVQIQVAQDGLVDTVTIIKVREGTDAINGLLTNEAANVATAADGSGASYAGTGGTFKVFDGVTDKTGDAAVTYSVAAATGVTIGIAATGVYTITAMSADTGSATLRAVYKGVTIDKVYSIARSKAGAAAAPAAYVVVSGQQVFSRATAAAAFAPASITLTATPYGGAATYQWQYLNAGSWTSIAGATAATCAVASGDFSDQRTYRVQATIGGTVYTDQVTLVQVTGGTSAVTGFLTNESVTFAADSGGTVASFTPANGTFKVYDGTTDKTGNAAVTYSVFSQTGCTVAITAAGAYSVSAMTTDTASATLRAVYNGVTIDKVLSLAKSRAGGTGGTGARGAGWFYGTGSAWSDATANAACPGGPVASDQVTISDGANYALTKRYDGAAWNAVGSTIDGNLLVTGSVAASKIIANGLSLKDPSGNVIINAGVTGGQLAVSAAAPGTLNSALSMGSDGKLSNGGTVQGQVTIGGLGYSGALDATRNALNQGLLSARPAGTNGDFYFATDTNVLYQKISGSWVVAANNYTNTNQLTDGAGLGSTANTDGSIRTPIGGYMSSSGNPANGAIKIRLPQSWTGTMLKMVVDIFEYQAGYSCTLDISGYTYSLAGSESWQRVSAKVVGNGSNVEYPVYFGHDGTKCCIWIGVSTEQWYYPKVQVRDVLAGHTNYSRSQWESGWQLSFDSTAAQNVTASVTDTLPGADWTKIPNRGTRPQDNATVGAPSGTNVGSTPATTVESNAANGQSAYSAVNDATTGLAKRLLNNARNVLSGGAGLAVGSLTWDNTGARTGGYGVGINSYGLVGYNSAGTLTFSINASTGAVAVAGDISGSTGTFGAVTIGSSASFGQSAYDTGNGGWIQGGATPKWSMRAANGKYMRIDIGAGVFELNGVSLTGSTITSPTINTPTISPITGGALTNISASSGGTSCNMGSRTVTPAGGPSGATYTCFWSIDGDVRGVTDPNYGIYIYGSANGTTVTLRAVAPAGLFPTYTADVTCAITCNGLTGYDTFTATVQFT